MKKFAILTLILFVFSLLLALPALAEEEGTTVQAVQMDWTQEVVEAFTAAGFDGNMATITLQDGLEFQMLIPEGFDQRELTAEEAELGVNLALTNEENGAMIRVRDCFLEGVNDVGVLANNRFVQIAFAPLEDNNQLAQFFITSIQF